MTIALRAVGTVATGTSTAPAAVIPAGVQNGDIAFLQVAVLGNGGGIPGTPTGWTNVSNGSIASGPAYNVSGRRLATTDASTTVTSSLTASTAWRARIIVFSGVTAATTNPLTSSTGAGSGSVTATTTGSFNVNQTQRNVVGFHSLFAAATTVGTSTMTGGTFTSNNSSGAPGANIFYNLAGTGGTSITVTGTSSAATANPRLTAVSMIPAVAPANDNFASAIDWTSGGSVTALATADATVESGEPAAISGTTNNGSVWYKYTPTVDSKVTIAIMANTNTVVGVYSGTAVNALTLVNNLSSGGTSTTTLQLLAGTTYYLRAYSNANYSGAAFNGVAAQPSVTMSSTTTTTVSAGGFRALGSETWTGPNGSAWPAQWTSYTGTNYAGTADIQSNQGRLLASANNYVSSPFMVLTGVPATLDQEVYAEYSFSAAQESYGILNLRSPNAIGQQPPNQPAYSAGGYQLTVCALASGEMDLTVGTSSTIVARFVPTGYSPTTTWSVRFRAVGTYIQARMWQTGTAEPTTWQINYTDNTQTTPGYFAAAVQSGFSTSDSFILDNLTLTNGGTSTGGADTYAVNTRVSSAVSDTYAVRTAVTAIQQTNKFNYTGLPVGSAGTAELANWDGATKTVTTGTINGTNVDLFYMSVTGTSSGTRNRTPFTGFVAGQTYQMTLSFYTASGLSMTMYLDGVPSSLGTQTYPTAGYYSVTDTFVAQSATPVFSYNSNSGVYPLMGPYTFNTLSDNYGVGGPVAQSNSDTYGVRTSVSSTHFDTYTVRSTASNPDSDTYAVRTTVSATDSDSYAVRTGVLASRTDTYAVRALVSNPDSDSYTVRSAVPTSRTDTYAVRTAVSSTHSDSYNVLANPLTAYNNAEGAPGDGAAVSVQNSGGASGTPFSQVYGTGVTYSAAAAYGGSNYGYRVDTSQTTRQGVTLQTGDTNETKAAARSYVYMTAYPATNTRQFQEIGPANLVQGTLVGVTPAGFLQTDTILNGTMTGTVQIPLNTWIRVEQTFDSMSGALVAKWFIGQSLVASDTINDTAATLQTLEMGYFGKWSNTTAGAAGANFYMDGLAFRTGSPTFIGPMSVVASNTASDSYTVRSVIANSDTDAYGVRSAVASTHTDNYTVRAVAYQTDSDTYKVSQAVSGARTDSYAVFQAVSAVDSDTYGVRQSASKSNSDAYAVSAGVLSNRSDTYGVRTLVSNTDADQYGVRAVTSTSSTDQYAVRSGVSNSHFDQYSVRVVAKNTDSDTYGVRQAVSNARFDSYSVTYALQNTHYDSYTVFTSVNSVSSDSYSVYTGVLSLVSDTYAVSKLVSVNVTDTYSVTKAVSRDVSDSYNIMVDVSADSYDIWAEFDAVESSVADNWPVLTSSTSSRSDSYSLRVIVKSLAYDRYTVSQEGLVFDASDRYRILQSVQNTVTDQFSTYVAVITSRTDTWSARQAISADRTNEFRVLTSLEAEDFSTWDVYGRIVSTASDTWRISYNRKAVVDYTISAPGTSAGLRAPDATAVAVGAPSTNANLGLPSRLVQPLGSPGTRTTIRKN